MNKTPIAIVLSSIIIAGAIYLGLQSQTTTTVTSKETSPVESIKPVTPTTSPTITPVATTPITISDEEAIKKSLLSQMSITEENLDFNITDNNHQVARGGVKDKNDVGGGMWLAAKVNENWTVTYIGNGVPSCSKVNPYNYPIDWIDYCTTEDGKAVLRK